MSAGYKAVQFDLAVFFQPFSEISFFMALY
jgi:hypothetical protein